jgi:Kef-type K+ transport system membrane component KefB
MTMLLLLQLVVILVAARACGWVLRYFGQPAVIGEMAAGLILGPVVLGAWMPEIHARLFPAASLPPLSALATLGLVLFMFVVGAELRAVEGTRAQVRAASLVGILGISLPLGLGLAISPWLYPRFAPEGLEFWPFALFIAAAMSVTAFPVLARILKDRNLAQTPAGRLAMSAAIIDDGFVWIFLALVLTLAGGRDGPGIEVAAAGAAILVAVAFFALKPLYAWLLERGCDADGAPDRGTTVAILIGLLGCAAFAEAISLHAVFGAFVFGVCLPRDNRLVHHLGRAFEPVSMLLLMPVVFALAGLNTTTQAFVGAGLGAFALILLVAVAGKMIGGIVGARLSGYDWRDSLAVGSLINARGLMELVVLKIGLDAGLIGPELFTLMFGMTLVTTVMTAPLLSLWARRDKGSALPDRGRMP